MTVPLIEYGVASSALPGETECGDLHVVRSVADGAIAAVLDGLGHGQEAAIAARAGADLLHIANESSAIRMVQRCHEALRSTRGAVMSLAWFSALDDTVTWVGVGNVEGRLLRAGSPEGAGPRSLLLRPGLLGHRLPPLRPSVMAISPGDTLLLATDGIDAAFADSVPNREQPQESADRIMARHWKGTDDALVMVVRYVGAR